VFLPQLQFEKNDDCFPLTAECRGLAVDGGTGFFGRPLPFAIGKLIKLMSITINIVIDYQYHELLPLLIIFWFLPR
jgi:hypothetical protein